MNATKAPAIQDIFNELIFIASRSGGPGGQHVNKVSTKITLKWDVPHSGVLSDVQRNVISKKLVSRMTQDGILLITAQDRRSQLQNKEEALRKLDHLLVEAFSVTKVRKPTRPGKAAKQKRIKEKKIRSEKKQWRQKP